MGGNNKVHGDNNRLFLLFYYNLESFFTDFLAYLRYNTFFFEAKSTGKASFFVLLLLYFKVH